MSNYTRPDDLNHQDSPRDWLGSAMVFANALGKLLEPNTGVVVKLIGEMPEMFEGEKVIVAHVDDQIKIIDCDEPNYVDGDFVKFK